MHYYPHHIGDYKSATAHLSNEEDLAYRRLLEMYKRWGVSSARIARSCVPVAPSWWMAFFFHP